ncbi:MAG TPA: DUF927 domain-containing protein [Pirellulales bacterium]|jgi:hypothetical protein|nr:DUF927 domain-containing protein [Pirellulales bacterium]
MSNNPIYATVQNNGDARATGANGVGAATHGSTPPSGELVRPNHPLVVVRNGQRDELAPGILLDEQGTLELQAYLQSRSATLMFDLRHLPDWQPNICLAVLTFIARLTIPYTVCSADGTGIDLFSVVVELILAPENIERCKAAINSATYAAALLHADAVPLAAERIAARLHEIGIRGYTVAALAKSINQSVASLRHAQVASDEPPLLVINILPDAPVGDGIVVPDGWELSPAGIRQAGTDAAERSIPAAVVISERLHNVRTGAEHLRIAWSRGQGWRSRVVPRATIATSRTITAFAEFGLPITSNNAPTAVQFLADFETYNFDELRLTEVTEQLGWHGGNTPDRFLLGNQTLCGREASTGHGDGQSLQFLGADEGDDQLVEGYHCAGSFADWREAVAQAGTLPAVALICYVSLTVPMLRLLESPNFVFSLAGATSRGKTSTLRVAASIWGRPDEKSPAAAIATWDSTRVYIERAMAVRCDTPFILDDTKLAKHPQDVTQAIYDAAAGRGKGRGSLTGTRKTLTWHTVLMMSGETPATAFTEAGGTRSRVLELWGSPFGNINVETARLINTINAGILRNFGHAGPAFIQFLLTNRDQWAELRQQYAMLRDGYQARAGDNSVALRMADHFAAIHLTAILAHQASIVPWPYRDAVAELWTVLTADSHEADRAAVALRYVMSWAFSHREEFSKHLHTNGTPPHAGWAGRWGSLDDFVGFMPHKLDELLRQGNFDAEATRRMWRDREWLRLTEGKNFYRARMLPRGDVVSLVAIKQAAITEVMGGDAEADVEDCGITPSLPTRPARG